MNARVTVNAQPIRPVTISSAGIHALMPADKALNVKQEIMVKDLFLILQFGFRRLILPRRLALKSCLLPLSKADQSTTSGAVSKEF